MTYEYARIRTLAEKLKSSEIRDEIVAEIMAGGETIKRTAKPEKKAQWMKEAMDRMDQLLDTEMRYAVREACACSLGGKRHEMAMQICKTHATLRERIQAANETPFVFGNRVTQKSDGSIEVCFFPEGRSEYRCVCLPKADGPISITYCYCCGGHVRHHLEAALGCKLKCTVQSSALSSGGKDPCTFVFQHNSVLTD